MSDDWRNDPATDKQKEKLRFFGCTWDEGITKGQASDALDQCAQQLPQRNAEWYDRPATPDQIEQLKAYGVEIEQRLTYEDAKELIEESEPDETPEQEYLEYLSSDEGMIDAFWELINEDFGDRYRAVTREEVAKA